MLRLRQRRNARAFCLGVRGLTSGAIRKALTFCALDGLGDAVGIFHALP